MVNKMRSICTILLFASISLTFAGPKLLSGDASVVKGEKSFNIEFVWEDWEYDGDPFEEYYQEEIEDFEKDGDTEDLENFKKEWEEWKTVTYPEGFASGFNFFLKEKMGIEAKVGNKDAKYTLIVKTIELDPGGMKLPKIEIEVHIVETVKHDNVVAKIGKLVSGGRLPGPEGVRVKDTYRMLGTLFARSFLYKKVLKD